MSDYDSPNLMSRKSVLASAIVLGIIIALGIGLTISNLIDSDPSSPPSNAQASADPLSTSTATNAADPAASICGLPGYQKTGTLTTAPPTTWTLVGTIAAPTVKDAGPGKIDPDGYRSCYAHTPTGAVAAAANYAAIGSNDALKKKFYSKGVVPGPGRDVLLSKKIKLQPPRNYSLQIAGFRILRYTEEVAEVQLVMRASTGQVFQFTSQVQWSSGDWKAVSADDGQDHSNAGVIPDLTGYIPWSGA
jgi:hypothetical protein